MKRVLYADNGGNLCVIIPIGRSAEEALEVDVPEDIVGEIVEHTDIPTDRTFRNAWKHDKTTGPKKVDLDMVKAKGIAHTMRRKQRDEAFKPLDLEVTIPSQAQAAEAARQAIRDADATKQTAIDNAASEAELRTALGI